MFLIIIGADFASNRMVMSQNFMCHGPPGTDCFIEWTYNRFFWRSRDLSHIYVSDIVLERTSLFSLETLLLMMIQVDVNFVDKIGGDHVFRLSGFREMFSMSHSIQAYLFKEGNFAEVIRFLLIPSFPCCLNYDWHNNMKSKVCSYCSLVFKQFYSTFGFQGQLCLFFFCFSFMMGQLMVQEKSGMQQEIPSHMSI